MKQLDRVLQNWRMARAARFVKPASRVLDVGAHRGELFRYLGEKLARGFGIEPLAEAPIRGENFVIEPGYFPAVSPPEKKWDVVTMLAVFEHIPRDRQAGIVRACHDLLADDGLVIITVPSPAVDYILTALRGLRLIDGMSLEEHYGFVPKDTLSLFTEPAFRCVHAERFQLGLNHLFVFQKQLESRL